MEYDQLMVLLEKHLKLTTAFKIELRKVVQQVRFDKGITLQNDLQFADRLWFVLSGSAKEVTVNQDTRTELTTWFWFTGDVIFTGPGFFNRVASDACIKLMEDSSLIYLTHQDYMRLRKQFPELEQLTERIRGYYDAFRKQHLIDLVKLSAMERFKKFTTARKAYYNVAMHKDVLEFLGIKADSYSRFKRLLSYFY